MSKRKKMKLEDLQIKSFITNEPKELHGRGGGAFTIIGCQTFTICPECTWASFQGTC